MLCFCDYRGVLPVNWDSNDSQQKKIPDFLSLFRPRHAFHDGHDIKSPGDTR